MRVMVPSNGQYIDPDFVVVCGKPEFLDEHEETLLNPTLIIEVLSPSTEAYDRGDKFQLYRSVESLRECVLIASDHVLVERYAGQSENQWLLGTADKLEAAIKLESVDLVRLADLYEKIEFSLAPPRMRRQNRPPGLFWTDREVCPTPVRLPRRASCCSPTPPPES